MRVFCFSDNTEMTFIYKYKQLGVVHEYRHPTLRLAVLQAWDDTRFQTALPLSIASADGVVLWRYDEFPRLLVFAKANEIILQ
jgi:hypothetical protein